MQPSLGEHEGATWGCQSSNSAVAGWPDGKEKLHYSLVGRYYLVHVKVRRMSQEEREQVMSFVDRAEEKGGQKTPWGVFLTNALPLGESSILFSF